MKKINIKINSEVFLNGIFSDYVFIDTQSYMTCACLFDIETIKNEYMCFYTELFNEYSPYKRQSIVIEYDVFSNKAYLIYAKALENNTETICRALSNIYLNKLKDERNILGIKTNSECFEIINPITKNFLSDVWHMNHNE